MNPHNYVDALMANVIADAPTARFRLSLLQNLSSSGITVELEHWSALAGFRHEHQRIMIGQIL